jgi:hypothetical protein
MAPKILDSMSISSIMDDSVTPQSRASSTNNKEFTFDSRNVFKH